MTHVAEFPGQPHIILVFLFITFELASLKFHECALVARPSLKPLFFYCFVAALFSCN